MLEARFGRCRDYRRHEPEVAQALPDQIAHRQLALRNVGTAPPRGEGTMLAPTPEVLGSHVALARLKRRLKGASVASLRQFAIIGIRRQSPGQQSHRRRRRGHPVLNLWGAGRTCPDTTCRRACSRRSPLPRMRSSRATTLKYVNYQVAVLPARPRVENFTSVAPSIQERERVGGE